MESPLVAFRVLDATYFTVTVPCGANWMGMRHTDDVRIILDRAMGHVDACVTCDPPVR